MQYPHPEGRWRADEALKPLFDANTWQDRGRNAVSQVRTASSKLSCRVGGRAALKISAWGAARNSSVPRFRRRAENETCDEQRQATVSGEGEVIEPRASCGINREYDEKLPLPPAVSAAPQLSWQRNSYRVVCFDGLLLP